MGRILRIIVFLLGAIALTGCHNVSYVAKTKMPSAVKSEHSLSFFLWGLAGNEDVNLAQDCGAQGVSKIHTFTSFGQGFIGVITLGIYVPRTAVVTCAQ